MRCKNILSEDKVDHIDKHAVLERHSSVLDNGDDICATGSHVDQVTARTVRELDSVDGAGRTDNVGDVGDGGTRGSTEVESLGAGLDVDGLETTENTSSQLGSERIPDTVFGLGGSAILSLAVLDGDTLLVVDALARGQVGGGKQIFLAATDNEDTLVPVGFLGKTRHVSMKIHSKTGRMS